MLKKLLISVIFLLLFTLSSYATQITITGTSFNNWKYGGTTAKLRIFANDKFLTSTGETIIPGGISGGGTWYKEVTCTVAFGTISCPDFILASTTNSSVPTATYTAAFYDYKNIRRDFLFQKWKVPSDSSTITFNQLLLAQSTTTPILPNTYYTSGQVDLLLGGYYTSGQVDAITEKLTGGQETQVDNKISAAIAGIDLSAKADVADTRFVRDIGTYGSLAAANAAISSPTTLNITGAYTVSSNITLNVNVCLNITDDGSLTVNSGVTLTIGCFVDPGNRKVFYSSGTGKVLFSKASVTKIKLVWWTGATSGQNVSDALDEALQSANATQIPIHVSQGLWYTTGNHTISEGVTIEGEGNHLLDNLGTVLRLQSPTSDNMFIIGQVNYSVRFENIILSGTGTTNKSGVIFRGTYPNSSGDTYFSKVTFQDFAKGIWYNDIEVGPNVNWQMAQVQIDQSIFWFNTAAIVTESLNSAFTINSSNFYIANNQTALLTNGIGITTITGCEFAGAVPAAGAVNRKVLVINGAHVQINFISNQDEGNTTFIENNASDITGIVNLYGNLIQSQLYINYSMTLNSVGNNYPPDAIRITPPATPHIFSQNDNIRVDVGTLEAPATIPANPLRLVKSTDPITQFEFNPTLASGSGGAPDGGLKIRQFSKLITPWYMSGFESTPVLQVLDSSNGGGETQRLLRLGRADSNQQADYYYDFYRSNSGTTAGRLIIEGNQTGFFGVDMKQDLKVDGAVRQQACPMVDTGTSIAFDPKCGYYFYVTLTGNRNLTPFSQTADEQNRSDGQKITLALTQDGTGGRTITPSTGVGQLAFSATLPSLTVSGTANKTTLIDLQYDKRLNKWLVTSNLSGY